MRWDVYKRQFLDIPNSPPKGTICPITKVLDVTLPPPSAENIASLSINALLTLFSWNIIKLVFSAYNLWIVPFAGFKAFVISDPTENTLVWFIPVLELNIPEYIKALPLIKPFGSSVVVYALTPKSTLVLL